MLVNHELKMVFMHAPKCAGIALTGWLVDHYGFTYYGDPDFMLPCGVADRHRYTLPDECAGYEVITCIREPIQRWESFYMYQSLQMGVALPFDQFTRERLKWLPTQTEYTKQATYILRVDQLDSEVLKLPFVESPVPEISRLNASQGQPGYQRVKEQIQWTDELKELVTNHFQGDFVITRTLSRSAS